MENRVGRGGAPARASVVAFSILHLPFSACHAAAASGHAVRHSSSLFSISPFGFHCSEDVPAQVLVLDDVGKLFGDVGDVDLDRFLLKVRSEEHTSELQSQS